MRGVSWLFIVLSACGFPRPADVGAVDDGGVPGTPDAKACSRTTCTNDLLEVCGPSGLVVETEQCALGCFADETRCVELVPSNGLASYLEEAGRHDAIALPAGSVVDTDSGTVTAAGNVIAVASATVQQTGGPVLRVLLARSWTLDDVRIHGTLPLAFVARDRIDVRGMLDASADAEVGGPGALVCGSDFGGGGPAYGFYARLGPGHSPGFPDFVWWSNGYGGGGFGTTGGGGGIIEPALLVGTPGRPNGTEGLVPLRGGCEGGGATPQYRGAGGGAIQLVGGRSVRLGGDGARRGTIHAGGGGSIAGSLGTNELGANPEIHGPGGGGSGGGILLDAPNVILDDGTAILAVGGGGGGFGACVPEPDGFDAAPNGAISAGGACSAAVSPRAAGGSGVPDGGTGGANALAGSAGGGGGGLGRIRINTADGQFTAGAGVLIYGVITTGTVGRR